MVNGKRLEFYLMDISHSVDLILKLVDNLWNRTSGWIVDKLSSATADFIRSERELENTHLYGAYNAYWACSEIIYQLQDGILLYL